MMHALSLEKRGWPVSALALLIVLSVLFAARVGTLGMPLAMMLALAAATIALAPWRTRAWRAAARLGAWLRKLRPGPLYAYDLIRLARRSRFIALRAAYALVLLLTLCFLHGTLFPRQAVLLDYTVSLPAGNDEYTAQIRSAIMAQQQAYFAHGFAVAVILLQCAAALVLTPVYVAGVVAEEKERRTLELLLTTQLSDEEIVLGKFLARLTYLGAVLLTGLPILFLLQFLGGLQPGMLLCGFVVTVFTLLSVGGMSLVWSVLARDVLRATLCSYLAVTVGLCALPWGLSPLAFLLRLDQATGLHVVEALLPLPSYILPAFATSDVEGMVAAYVVWHGGIALGCVWLAVLGLRCGAGTPAARPEPETIGAWKPVETAGWDPLPQTIEASLASGRAARVDRVLPPVGDQPLLWKELYHRASAAAAWTFRAVYLKTTALALLVIAAMVVILVLSRSNTNEPPPLRAMLHQLFDAVHGAIHVVATSLALLWCVAAGLRAAGSVSVEQEQRTLLNLLLLPGDRADLLEAKWLGSILRYRQLGYLLAATWTVGLISGGLHPAAVGLLATACLAHLLFFASLGVWLSVATRNTLVARTSIVLVLLVLVFSGVVWELYARLLEMRYAADASWRPFIESGLSPLRAWWYLALSWPQFAAEVLDTDRAFSGRYLPTLLGLLAFVVFAWALWREAGARFGREESAAG